MGVRGVGARGRGVSETAGITEYMGRNICVCDDDLTWSQRLALETIKLTEGACKAHEAENY